MIDRLRPILVAGAAAVAVAALGGSMTDIGPWYQSLRFPAWKPPDWLFGPAWTIIFALCALSAATAWRDAREPAQRDWMIGLFALNGFLNVLWSFLFFTAKRPDWALVEVFALWFSILLLIGTLQRYSRPAAWMLVPYLAWVTFAAALNWAIVSLNPSFG